MIQNLKTSRLDKISKIINLLVTLIAVLLELALPPELLTVQLYKPISVVLTFWILRVEFVSPGMTIPFLNH